MNKGVIYAAFAKSDEMSRLLRKAQGGGNGSTYLTDTDSTGRYSVNVPPGVYTLLINDPCCKPISERVPVDAELNADYSIDLEYKYPVFLYYRHEAR